jgi:hypothetical protein
MRPGAADSAGLKGALHVRPRPRWRGIAIGGMRGRRCKHRPRRVSTTSARCVASRGRHVEASGFKGEVSDSRSSLAMLRSDLIEATEGAGREVAPADECERLLRDR